MYNTIEHAASVELEIEDVDDVALFPETLLAIRDVLCDANGGTPVTHEVTIEGPDLQGLLVEWVNELVRLAEDDGFIPERIDKERLEPGSFRARVAGERGIPAERIRRLECRTVGLRRLDDGAWAARVMLDSPT
jgi:SHS2 domain-containing protein